MVKKLLAIAIVVVFVFSACAVAFCEEKEKTITPAATQPSTATPAGNNAPTMPPFGQPMVKGATPPFTPGKMPPSGKAPMLPGPGMKAAFSMVSGNITAIDKTNPNDIKISIKSATDGKTRVLSATPQTSVTKVTDISELKEGEEVRVMARKMENDKEMALNIMSGKIKMPPPPPASTPANAPAKAAEKKKA